jgi:PRTRC genetic system protein E
MFRELAPLLRHRAVLLTVTHLGDDQIRVNVVPKKLKDEENEALTTAVSVTGTADELDADLPKTLVDYVGGHLQLKNSLESAKAQMDAAAKAAQEEARAKTKAASKSGKTQPTVNTNGQTGEAAKSVEAPKPAVPRSPSLFDLSPAPALSSTPAAAPVVPVAAAVEATPAPGIDSEEDEILAEVDEQGDDDLLDAA